MTLQWTPQEKGNVILRVEVEAEEDIDLENNIKERSYIVGANAPDLFVVNIYVERRILPVNEESEMRVYIGNIGPKDAENISLTVLGEYEGQSFEINRTYIEKIEGKGGAINPVVKWTPDKIGRYKIEAVVETEGDENLENNREERFVDVLPDAPDIFGVYNWNEDKPIINQPYSLIFMVGNQGFKIAEKVNVSLFKRIEGDRYSLIESRTIDSLFPDKTTEIIFNWIPENIGGVDLKLLVEAENESNLENNIYFFSLKVLNDKPDVRVQYMEGVNIVVNKENLIEFYLSNDGGESSDDIHILLYSIDEISGEEILLANKSAGVLGAGKEITLEISYKPDEVGIKRLRVKADVESDYDLSNNEENFQVLIVSQSRLTNLGNDALQGYLFLEFQRLDRTVWEWESYAVLIDDQKNGNLRTLERGETLALDKLYNELEIPNIIHTGRFRVYVAFLDENRNVIETNQGRLLEASREFT